ncbi:Hypothetical protein MVR_LOCUS251 [uncultured virus]|nr:Hypothetical protein MVR_LOCUS251 [uncultured virus]
MLAIDPKILDKSKLSKSNLIQEQLKLKKIEDDAKVLVRNVKQIRIILDDGNAPDKQKAMARKQLEGYSKQRDKLVASLKKQQKVVEDIEENKRIEDLEKKKAKKAKTKAKEKAKTKSKSKSKRKSGSKTKAKSKSSSKTAATRPKAKPKAKTKSKSKSKSKTAVVKPKRKTRGNLRW